MAGEQAQESRKPRGRGCLLWGCLTVVIVFLVGIIGAGVFFGRSTTATQQVAATVKVVQGKAEIKRGTVGDWEMAQSGAELKVGDSVRVDTGGVVFVNYFEGSTSRLDGPAEMMIKDSTEVRSEPGFLAPLIAKVTGKSPPVAQVDTKVSAKVVLGKITTKVAKLTSSTSSFEVAGPNSVAGVQGTILELVVLPNGEAFWRAIEGEVKVGAVTVNAQNEPVAIIIPLTAGGLTTIPPLPPQFANNQAQVDKLLEATREIMQEIIKQESQGGNANDVKLSDRALLAVGTESGVAVFDLQKVAATPVPTATPLPGPPKAPTPTAVTTPLSTPVGTRVRDEVVINIPGFVFVAGTPTPTTRFTPTPTSTPVLGATPTPTPATVPGATPTPTPTPDIFAPPGERTITLGDGDIVGIANGQLGQAPPEVQAAIRPIGAHITPGRVVFVSTGVASGGVQVAVSGGRLVAQAPPGAVGLVSKAVGRDLPTSIDVTGYIPGLPGGATITDVQTGNGFMTIFYR